MLYYIGTCFLLVWIWIIYHLIKDPYGKETKTGMKFYKNVEEMRKDEDCEN